MYGRSFLPLFRAVDADEQSAESYECRVMAYQEDACACSCMLPTCFLIHGLRRWSLTPSSRIVERLLQACDGFPTQPGAHCAGSPRSIDRAAGQILPCRDTVAAGSASLGARSYLARNPAVRTSIPPLVSSRPRKSMQMAFRFRVCVAQTSGGSHSSATRFVASGIGRWLGRGARRRWNVVSAVGLQAASPRSLEVAAGIPLPAASHPRTFMTPTPSHEA
ncbi:hypothetical protein GY45DRAFT_758557 [Cubamyces sp. BRFM 1775]|nr:hypothetical protein GY45DRAFT_758557 [Cubamyces sp. BRFM 1775]